MQYLLTQEEYSTLTNKIAEYNDMPSKKALESVLVNTAHQHFGGCAAIYGDDWCCDNCPFDSICTLQRIYSK